MHPAHWAGDDRHEGRQPGPPRDPVYHQGAARAGGGEDRPMDATVRTAESGDADAVLALAVRFATSFAVEEGPFRESFAALLASREAHLTVAEQGETIVGYLLGFD